eukprot:4793093-Amphidinium_carterae.1
MLKTLCPEFKPEVLKSGTRPLPKRLPPDCSGCRWGITRPSPFGMDSLFRNSDGTVRMSNGLQYDKTLKKE